MKKLLVLLVLMSAGFALAESVTLWSCDFETSEGFSLGKLAGQNDWAKLASWANDSVYVEEGDAVSGEQYIHCEPNNGVNVQNNSIDISKDYVPGSTLAMRVYAKADFVGTQPMSLRLHCLGTSGRQHSVEICEINIYQDGTARIDVNGGNLSVSGLVQGKYYEFGVIFEPDQKKVKKIFIGDNEKEGDNLYYYSVETAGCGSLPDGFRFYDGGGCVDDIKIEMVPEPAIFGLVALLGLFFARKQR
jgi:hypothetical protein